MAKIQSTPEPSETLLCHAPSLVQRQAMLAAFRTALARPNLPVPEPSLKLLFEAAVGDTGGGQAARYFLFWLAGRPDPTGFVGDGGLELRRMDGSLQAAALEVMRWWAGPIRSGQPLYDLLHDLEQKFSQSKG